MVEEKSIVMCRECGEMKERIQDGKYGVSKNKRWRDENGKLWRGKVCPACHKDDMGSRMISKRSKDKSAKSDN